MQPAFEKARVEACARSSEERKESREERQRVFQCVCVSTAKPNTCSKLDDLD